MSRTRPITLTIAALGGQGGGVVMNWMIAVAEAAGYLVQATSVPGVAQRTGATIYYLEFAPRPSSGEPQPVMALMPSAGASDLVVASELAEAVRMVERGIVDPATTTLVTSTHRAYTIDEKSHLGDGRARSEELLRVADEQAKTLLTLDMAALANRHGSVISAAILGGIAASGRLPFSTHHYEQAIERSGKGVAPSLLTFRAACQSGSQASSATPEPQPPLAELPPALANRVGQYPDPLPETLVPALARLLDYQDDSYAEQYLARLDRCAHGQPANPELAKVVANNLALWMSFEDTIRVAQQKTRPERIQRLLKNGSENTELRSITEFMKPRVEEICGTLPVPLGRWAQRSTLVRALLKPLTRGLHIRTSSLSGYLILRALARLRPWRPKTLRFAQEQSAIDDWLDQIQRINQRDGALAIELAHCQTLVAGYGDTYARGLDRYRQIGAIADDLLGDANAAARIRQLREAALQDDTGDALSQAMLAIQQQEAA